MDSFRVILGSGDVSFCTHEPAGKCQVIARGKLIEFKDSPLCAPCLQNYIDAYATVCAWCGGPILPGMPIVAGGPMVGGLSFPYCHAWHAWSQMGGWWCEGEPIGLAITPEGSLTTDFNQCWSQHLNQRLAMGR